MQQHSKVIGSRELIVERVASMAVQVRVLGVKGAANVEAFEIVTENLLGGVIVNVPVLVEVGIGTKHVQKVVETETVSVELVLLLARQHSGSIASVAGKADRALRRGLEKQGGLAVSASASGLG